MAETSTIIQSAVIFFRFKFPLNAGDFNQMLLGGYNPGILNGFELSKDVTNMIVNLNPGSALVSDANLAMTRHNTPSLDVIKVNSATVSSILTDHAGNPNKNRVILWYEYATDTAISSKVHLDLIDPTSPPYWVGTTEVKNYIILGDIVWKGDTIDSFDYSMRDYCQINEDLLHALLPDTIGLRYFSTTTPGENQIKLVKHNHFTTDKYRLDNIGNVTLVSSNYRPTGILLDTVWKSSPKVNTHYYAFLCLDTSGAVVLKFYSDTEADWDNVLFPLQFNGVRVDYPFHRFIGEFYTGSWSGTPSYIPTYADSFYDSFLNCPRGDIRMFSGKGPTTAGFPPLGWAVCSYTNSLTIPGCPNLEDKFILQVNATSGVRVTGGQTLGSVTLNVVSAPKLLATDHLAHHHDTIATHTHGEASGYHFVYYDSGHFPHGWDGAGSFGALHEGTTTGADSLGGHTHADFGNSVGTQTRLDVTPPFYKLIYAIKL